MVHLVPIKNRIRLYVILLRRLLGLTWAIIVSLIILKAHKKIVSRDLVSKKPHNSTFRACAVSTKVTGSEI